MNKDLLCKILKEKGIYRKTSAGEKNLICKCPICGDHPDEKKAKHLYISTTKNMYHCFLNGCSGLTNQLLKKLGLNINIKEIFTKDELEIKTSHIGGIVKKKNLVRDLKKFIFPEIKPGEYINKRQYIKNRIDHQTNPENIPGLVFDIMSFCRINDIKIDSNLFDLQFINDNFIGIVLEHQTIMACRCIHNNIPIKFIKLPLQDDILELTDYYKLFGGSKHSNKIVMAEGNFSLLGEYYYDTLGIKENVNMYIATQSFDNTSSVLKSISFDTHIFTFEVIFLSDTDKPIYKYYSLVNKCNHVLKTLDIYYNKERDDFGNFPIVPIKGGTLRDVKKIRKNSKIGTRYIT